MADIQHWNLQRILESLQLEINDGDTVGAELTELAIEAQGEVLDILEDESITAPATADSRLGNIINIRTKGKWVEKSDSTRGERIISHSEKLLDRYVGKKKKSQNKFHLTAGPEA